MSWEFAPDFNAGQRAVLAAGKNLVYLSPPAWWPTLPLFSQIPRAEDPGPVTIVLVPQVVGIALGAELLSSVESLRVVYGISGLSRASRILGQDIPHTIIVTPADLQQLISRSRLSQARIKRVVVGWPELLHRDLADMTDSVLAEFGGLQRIVITANESSVKDFVERHARRSPIVPAAPVVRSTAKVRYAVVSPIQLTASVRTALDIVNPASALIWDPTPLASDRWREYEADPTVRIESDVDQRPVDLALVADLPTGDALECLVASSREVLVLVQSHQMQYLDSIVERMRFDEFDPATVAAALAARTPSKDQQSDRGAALPAWVRIRVTAGHKDRIRTGDVVGALLNAVGISKDQIGRVEVRDAHSVVDVRADVAQRVLRELEGIALRGKRVTARIDRR
ncbi:MAG: DbpA RNA binding domain-containing protein [Gemmatimonadales bacterium]